MERILSLVFFGFAVLSTFGQVTETLDKNNVSLVATANGQLFNDQNGAGYTIPKALGVNAIYTQSLWFGALDANGQLRMAAERYSNGDEDFFPGPYSTNNSYNDPNYISEYTPALWKVSKADIEAHTDEYAAFGTVANPHPSILNWPGNGDASLGTASILAPFEDQNGDGIYDPYGGDYPKIKGCEGLYIIMNDSKDTIGGTQTPSMNIEIHILLYQYASLDYLNDITFMDIRVINRGTDDLLDFISATYTDSDLGDPNDDYIGCDPVRNVVYTYNSTNNDIGSFGSNGYGQGPPAIGVMYLNQTMNHSGYYTNGGASTQTDPSSAGQFWNYMNGKWRFGDPWVYGGSGFPGSTGATTIPTNHLFTGANDPMHISTGGVDPGFEWSEEGSFNPGGDRRMFSTTELGILSAGDEIEIHQAIVFGRDSTLTNFENVDVMLAVADSVQAFYDAGLDDCNDPFVSITPIENLAFSLFPNPSEGLFTIQLPQMTNDLQVEVRDVYGKLVYASSINTVETVISLNESAGLYFVTISGNGAQISKKLILE